MEKKTVLALWKKVSACITDEISNNDEFAKRIGSIFEDNLVKGKSKAKIDMTKPKRSNRREPSKVDPFILLEQGIDAFKGALELLDIEELKDVIAEHGMDSAKLAMKWKDRNRLINHIIDTTQRRSSRGEAFWNTTSEKPSDDVS
ncbi:MAG TPA: hypothetical protein PKN87_08645 [Syntrophomonadaceae bacterium]|nr:hypothetical protein [Syntrophomonadaceae bacterium]HPR93805.1 hypothetical protein [Syntrophomonadaceae bacterium]